ncbi:MULTISPECIES: hypothetical protein [Mycobacterium]|uniref:Uncharacterized protein n=1 Tax=Mycobacterium kiyosense TaxID=2871094 RepID=A0A9P3UT64_9MYCO|nr:MULTISPECIES: hypothetical protein [Mycobacterium]BDE15159.1 hypothetical protein MKCMC460_40190 [Mycobacterium sp. 20KCMC460]GLB81642.1 hypothetical protein SRL2020028_08980 [Mycobacterium kiyosense]GLB87579.1 hypothetical protein SRL2020130_03960 [Mycobacterium kiyosense]GLB94222.1 hypothetical protein SRL2020226_09980 [Mycobacterium kiyosense]GLC01723.1 hypothetical protein SRL2020400_23140 [Mycobacterium kiyosense]
MRNNDQPEIIDVEAEELPEDRNLPAVIETPVRTYRSDEPIREQRDWPQGPSPERRCGAHRKNGDRCKNAAIKGGTVCRYHGGAAKHVKAAARARIENAADLMARELLGIALTADNESVKLAAIRDALDRAGLKAPAEVVLSQGETKPYETVFDSIGGDPQTAGYPSAAVPEGSSAGVDASPAPAYDPYADSSQAGAGAGVSPDATTGYGSAGYEADEHAQPSSDTGPQQQGRPRSSDRDRRNQRAERHITGEAAIRAANWANAAMAESHGLPWGESARPRR